VKVAAAALTDRRLSQRPFASGKAIFLKKTQKTLTADDAYA
jgi:hypothetical protein